MPEEELAIRHLSKTFGGQRALDDVSIRILYGEVHGLIGQNGSGKSTLIKVLAGYHDPDPGGHLEIGGRVVKLPVKPGDLPSLGLSFVHQDLGLFPSLTVLENFRARKISTTRQWHMRWGAERKHAEETFARFGLKINPNAKVSDLPAVERALLAIVRAVEDMAEAGINSGTSKGLLVLDEPTVFLPKTGKDQLFKLVHEIVASGASVLFVSHDLDEALCETDRITVLRDGRVAGTLVSSDTSKDRLVEMMIGRRLEAVTKSHWTADGGRNSRIAVQGLTGRTVKDVSFELQRGEILGLSGLVGSGCEEVPYLMFGATPAQAGRLTIEGEDYDLTKMTPTKATRARIALLPGDRGDGGVGSLPVMENLMLQVLGRYLRPPRIDRRPMLRDSREVLREYDVRPAEPSMDFQALSGGNQQKVLLAKWFQTDPRLLVVHEPTQGVDIASRRQVSEIMKKAAEAGMSVVCASSDHEQLAAVCDRVLVFCDGRRCGELSGDEISKERIAEWCYGGPASERFHDELRETI
jgi:ribose transport system ATP-binding protein